MVAVGKITTAHGIKGEVKVASLSDNPNRFKKGSQMQVADGGEVLTVAAVRFQNEVMIIKFREINDRNQAELLRGKILEVNEEEVAPLEDDSYYIFQLEGLTVVDEEGVELGELLEVIPGSANDVFRVRRKEGGFVLLPALKSLVKKVDLEQKTMTVKLLPGLWEACSYAEN